MATLRSQPEPRKLEAQKLRKRYTWLQSFSDQELHKITMCSLDEGERQANEEYFDLSRPELGPIRGRSGAVVPEGSCYVSKSQLNPALWNKLINGFVR